MRSSCQDSSHMRVVAGTRVMLQVSVATSLVATSTHAQPCLRTVLHRITTVLAAAGHLTAAGLQQRHRQQCRHPAHRPFTVLLLSRYASPA
jgi:hypothetical protein